MRERAIPTATARQAASALTDLVLARKSSGAVGDTFFASDWAQLWATLTDDGWTAIGDLVGTSGDDALDLLDLTLIAEAWGAHLIPLPLIETIALRRSLSEPPSPKRRLSYAVRDGDVWLAPFGDTSEIVTIHRDAAVSVERPTQVKDLDRFARSLPIAIVSGSVDELPDDSRATIAILTTAGAIGAAAAALEKSIEYAIVREQFGRPIGSFQAVKHRLANMHVGVELARSAIALSCSERASVDGALDAALDLCLRITEDAIQVHGGIGFTWEASPHHHLRHVMAARRIVTATLAR